MNRTFILLIVAAGMIFLQACSGKNEKSDAYGNFEAREIIVSAQAQGKLVKLELQEGQTLTSGQTVGWIDTSTLAARREQLMAQKNSLNAKLANIQAQMNVQQEQINTLITEKRRIERLLNEEAATGKQYDNIKGQVDVARMKMESIRSQKQLVYAEGKVLNKQLKELQTQITKCQIVNPIRGTVLEKYLEPTEMAAPGRAIYKIADVSKMTLRVYVSGAQLPHVKIGQQVEVLVDKNDKENQLFRGKVTWISPEAEFTPKLIQTKSERVDLVYAVKVRVHNEGTIKIGMPGEVNFNHRQTHASSSR